MDLKLGDTLYCFDEVREVDYVFDGENENAIYSDPVCAIRKIVIDRELETIVAGDLGLYGRVVFNKQNPDNEKGEIVPKELRGLVFYLGTSELEKKHLLCKIRDHLVNLPIPSLKENEINISTEELNKIDCMFDKIRLI